MMTFLEHHAAETPRFRAPPSSWRPDKLPIEQVTLGIRKLGEASDTPHPPLADPQTSDQIRPDAHGAFRPRAGCGDTSENKEAELIKARSTRAQFKTGAGKFLYHVVRATAVRHWRTSGHQPASV